MAYTYVWDETAVSDDTYGYDLDVKINNNLNIVRERLSEEHLNPNAGSGQNALMHMWNVTQKSTGSPYTLLITDHVLEITTGASNYELDLPSAVTYPGKPYKIKKVDSGTGFVIIDPNGAQTIDGENGVTLRNQYDFVEIVSNGTNWIIISSNFALRQDLTTPKNLILSHNGANLNQVWISFDEICVGNSPKNKNWSLHVVDIGVSGIDGLDTGTEAPSTWYYVWLIYNPETGVLAGLFSTSATSPTMPSGYTQKRLISVVRNNSSSNFIPFQQMMDKWIYLGSGNDIPKIIDNGGSVATAEVNITAYVPSKNIKGFFGKIIQNTSASTFYYHSYTFANSLSEDNGTVYSVALSGNVYTAMWEIPCVIIVPGVLDAPKFYYQVSIATVDAWMCGFTLQNI